MFTSETIAAIIKEIPGVLDIVIRYWHELAKYGLSVLRKML